MKICLKANKNLPRKFHVKIICCCISLFNLLNIIKKRKSRMEVLINTEIYLIN